MKRLLLLTVALSLSALAAAPLKTIVEAGAVFWVGRDDTPDLRWEQALRAINEHLMICMNDNAPDVAVLTTTKRPRQLEGGTRH
ncbi:MAG: hypothetical protein ABSH20_20525 [Tepidisphaeraceae bacterium]|jgi:hypothetical protein